MRCRRSKQLVLKDLTVAVPWRERQGSSSWREPCQNPHVTTAFSLRQHEQTQLSVFNSQLRTMRPATLRPFLPRPAIRRRVCFARSYALQTPGNPTLEIFNRNTKYLQKERAGGNAERSRQVDYLKDEVALRLSERLLVIVMP